mgnify:CR=1 FL=1
MSRNPLALLVLSLAMLVAPLGVCLGRGHVQAMPASTAMDHGVAAHQAATHGHEHVTDRGDSKNHFCPDCKQTSFVAGAKAIPDRGALLSLADFYPPAIARVAVVPAIAPAHFWNGRAPPIPLRLPLETKVRLQI